MALACLAAQDKPQSKRKLEDRQWIEGKIVCLGCTLAAQEGGAESECTLHAKHAQGLLAPDGTLWTFVHNTKGNCVMTDERLRDKEVKIFGWKFAKAQYIEVFKYQVKEGDKWRPYDFCKVCKFEPDHDNKDTDFCPDCKEDK
jgi:hypothetical protein